MDNEVKEFLAALQKKLVSIDYIKTEDIPNIGLYMDQVTTFMDEQLEACKRYEDDKILTKTMINNYAKNNLLPAPEKKKYSKAANGIFGFGHDPCLPTVYNYIST